MYMHEVWLMVPQRLLHLSFPAERVDGPHGGESAGDAALDMIIVGRQRFDLMAMRPEQPFFSSDYGVFTALLLISVMDNQNFHCCPNM